MAQIPHPIRPGVQTHISQHNVANAKPYSVRNRMFFRLSSGELRLYRPGDPAHPDRTGKMVPEERDLPDELQELIGWYQEDYCRQIGKDNVDPVLAMIGVGRKLWANESGDTFIKRERDEVNWRTAADSSLADELWHRLVKHEGETFHTVSGKPFRYAVDGNGVFFERDGHRINMRMARSDFDKAVSRLPLSRTTDIKDCRDYTYLFALLTDSRIVRRTDLAA